MHRRRLATALGLAVAVATGGAGAAAARGAHPDVPAKLVTVQVHAIHWGDPLLPVDPPLVPPPPWDVRALSAVQPRGGVECDDGAFTFQRPRARWTTSYSWRFRVSSTPDGITKAGAARALKSAMRNITEARNECGFEDRVDAEAFYFGDTSRKPGVTASGRCGDRDEFNVVGFGRMPDGIAGLTCVWSYDGRILEADVRLDAGTRWATSLAGCHLESMLEAVATHEFGHVFGMGHVSEANHGRLTMSTRLDGLCNNQESMLGKGDIRGLEQLY
jgi:hypothetical protein